MESLEMIIARVLAVDAATINDQSGPSNIPKWTSLVHVRLVAEVEKRYKVRFQIDEIIKIKSVLDFKNALKSKSVNLNG